LLATFTAARFDALGIRHVVMWGAVAEVAVFAVNRQFWEGRFDRMEARLRDSTRSGPDRD